MFEQAKVLESDISNQVEQLAAIGKAIVSAVSLGDELVVRQEFPCYLYVEVQGHEFTFGMASSSEPAYAWQSGNLEGAPIPCDTDPNAVAQLFWNDLEEMAIKGA